MPELNWLGDRKAKLAARQVPYRLLQPVEQVGDPASDNLLIQGDNLDALKSLLPLYAGRVKCIFIDPPYNTKSAFEHYDDNLEHSQWLSMMYPRLELLRELLAEDGSIWVTIDDNEGHYLKVMMDEVFGRANFVANVIWEKSDSPKMDSRLFSSRHDHVLVFAKGIDGFKLNRLEAEETTSSHYNRTDDQGRRYYTKPLRAMGSGEDTREARPSMFFPITAPDGTSVYPRKPDGTDGRWRWSQEKVALETDRIEWVDGRNGWSAYYRIYADNGSGRPPETIWPHSTAGSNRTSKAEVKLLFGADTTFTTPKPEAVVSQALRIATNPDDLVLDSFLGSGTTAAVAHKMGRRWIGIEMGEHARTHCLPRLTKVVEGEQGGISAAVNWQGGGGFRFMQLGEPVFEQDGRISPSVRFAPLAAYLWFAETRRPWHGGTAADGCPARRIPCLTPWMDAVDEAEREGDPLPPRPTPAPTPLLGVHGETAIVLLYNGILGDRRPQGGNVLTHSVWEDIRGLLPDHSGSWLVYGEASRLQPATLRKCGIEFRQIPYDIKLR